MWLQTVLTCLLLVASAKSFPQSRVVNGTDSDITKYPFMVSLRGSTGSHSCGSSIISSRYILTAAHCVVGKTAASISIQYSVTDINKSGPNIASVKRIIVHSGYNPAANYAHDIALLELYGELSFNYRTLAPVTLPEAGFEIPQVPEGAPGVLTGWGLNATGGVVQNHLQEVNLKIYSDDECATRHNFKTNENQICGGVDEGGKGQCSGDSGGPLLLDGQVQLGIVSWSIKPCTVAPYPGVYTKVSHYIDWIEANMD
ncbi:chymotrypsin-2-like [Teleopsis dalmanni]|uniref:chymotrypsin-2-like n=1 Tax=Teleopsis dalmanni TaxID=139649 RepID=UPI000D32D11E|nr:chymotrypsin-2-like [Teleopsis dalmanni]